MPSKKVTMRASMSNQITHFGIMGGLFNRKISGRSSLNRVTSRLLIPAGADAGLRYMKSHNLLSRNPLGSGGVGRMFNIRPRGGGVVLKHTILSIETEVALDTTDVTLGEKIKENSPNIMTVYFAHKTKEFCYINKDGADAAGELYFLTTEVYDDSYKYLSKIIINIDDLSFNSLHYQSYDNNNYGYNEDKKICSSISGNNNDCNYTSTSSSGQFNTPGPGGAAEMGADNCNHSIGVESRSFGDNSGNWYSFSLFASNYHKDSGYSIESYETYSMEDILTLPVTKGDTMTLEQFTNKISVATPIEKGGSGWGEACCGTITLK
jgi:hypothetical protein